VNQRFLILTIGFLLLISGSVLAETKLLLEINQLDFKDSRVNAKPTAISFGAEYAFNKHYSVIAKYGTKLESDEGIVDERPVDFEIDSLYGVYFKSYMSQSSKLNLYFMAGYTKTQLTGDFGFNTGELSQSDDGVSLGLGIEYQLNRSLALTANYNRMFDGSEAKMDGMNFGVSYAF